MAMRRVIEEILSEADAAPDKALSQMPPDFAGEVYKSIAACMKQRQRLLAPALAEPWADRRSPHFKFRSASLVTPTGQKGSCNQPFIRGLVLGVCSPRIRSRLRDTTPRTNRQLVRDSVAQQQPDLRCEQSRI